MKAHSETPFGTWVPAVILLLFFPFVGTSDTWLAGIAIGLIILLIGQQLFRRHTRIERVSSAYLEAIRGGAFTNGFDVLFRAGVVDLANRWEMQAVFQRMSNRGHQHPNQLPEKLKNKEVLKFLKYCHRHSHSLSTLADVAFAIALFRKKL